MKPALWLYSGLMRGLQPWLLLASAVGVVVLSIMLARKVLQLITAYRTNVAGSRLTVRTVTVFGALVVLPLLTVYLFSLEFLNRGIDSWFRVEIKQGLNDAVVLSRAALELRMREYSSRTEALARRLGDNPPAAVALELERELRASGANEIVLYGAYSRILAATSRSVTDALPSSPPEDLLRQVNNGRTYLSLDPRGESQYVIRTAVPLASRTLPDARFVLVVYDLPRQFAELTDAVQRSYSQYGDLAALPRLAVVVAEDRRCHGRPVCVTASPRRKPHRHDQPTTLQLNAMPRPGREHLPNILGTKLVERRRDLDWRAPAHAVVVAVQHETARVFEAEKKRHAAGGVRDGDGIVVSHIGGRGEVLRERDGILRLRSGHLGDLRARQPRRAVVRRAAQENVDGAPVALVAFARLAIREHRAAPRDHDAGDAVERVAFLAGLEQIHLLQRRRGGESGERAEASNHQAQRREEQS